MISTWMNDIFFLLDKYIPGIGGKLDFSNPNDSALIAVISF